MIIRQLHAENMFKFARLELSGLPERGRILVSGANESGKSAVMEVICLALFGQTPSLTPEQLPRAVKWGETRATVTLSFRGSNGQEFSVYRFFDTKGECGARFKAIRSGETLAVGVEAVNRAIAAWVGVDYSGFLDTLYWSQRRNSLVAQASTLKKLAGMTVLDDQAAALEQEVANSRGALARVQVKIAEFESYLANFEKHKETFDGLEEQRAVVVRAIVVGDSDLAHLQHRVDHINQSFDKLVTSVAQMLQCSVETTLETWQSEAAQLENALQSFDAVLRENQEEKPASLAAVHLWLTHLQSGLAEISALMATVTEARHRLASGLDADPAKVNGKTPKQRQDDLIQDVTLYGKQRQHRFTWMLFFLFLAVLGCTVWAGLYFFPEAGLARYLAGLLQEHVRFWDASSMMPLRGVNLLLVLIVLHFYGKVGAARQAAATVQGRLDELNESLERDRSLLKALDAIEGSSLSGRVNALLQWKDVFWAKPLEQWSWKDGGHLLDETRLNCHLFALQKQMDGVREALFVRNAGWHEQLRKIRESREEHTQASERLKDRLAHEMGQDKEKRSVRTKILALRDEETQENHRLRRYGIAVDLLRGACKELSSRFSLELRGFITKAVPLFTGGRYQHLQIDESMNIVVFSTEKKSFIDINEGSTGVQQQLNLAVRLALTQTLLARADSGEQFMLLDDPFVYFDRQRLRESFGSLLRFNERVAQIWFAAQTFDSEDVAEGDLHLECAMDQDTLVFSGVA